MKTVKVSIDLSKIDKSKIIQGSNGAKYYNITCIIKDEYDKYGKNVLVVESTKSKTEKGTIIGSGWYNDDKVPEGTGIARRTNDTQKHQEHNTKTSYHQDHTASHAVEDDGLPF